MSPSEQRERIAAACERDGLELIQTIEELDVSGGTPLAEREGLRSAVEAVETGQAQVIVAAYFDRLMRSLRVQEEVVGRVEAAGGAVMAVDVGAISGETASQWVAGTFLGAMNEYQRRATRERVRGAQVRAVERGVPPWSNIPPGYIRGADGILRIDPTGKAVAVRRAFELRVDGAPIREVRDFLRANGIERSYHGVGSMLASRVYLGEIHFGSLSNLEAHEPLIDRDLWERVQRMRVSRGRKPHSDRLLARLGVLRCGSCGARMVVGTAHHGRYPLYRCPPTGDCQRRVTVGAEIVERVVVDAVRKELTDVEGSASVERDAVEAVHAFDRAQSDLDAAIRAFSGLLDEPAAREKLASLRERRDSMREEAHRLSHLSHGLTVNIAKRWDDLTLAEQRGFIRAVVARAVVGPGRGAERITVELLREHPLGNSIG